MQEKSPNYDRSGSVIRKKLIGYFKKYIEVRDSEENPRGSVELYRERALYGYAGFHALYTSKLKEQSKDPAEPGIDQAIQDPEDDQVTGESVRRISGQSSSEPTQNANEEENAGNSGTENVADQCSRRSNPLYTGQRTASDLELGSQMDSDTLTRRNKRQRTHTVIGLSNVEETAHKTLAANVDFNKQMLEKSTTQKQEELDIQRMEVELKKGDFSVRKKLIEAQTNETVARTKLMQVQLEIVEKQRFQIARKFVQTRERCFS